jgi:hypothetical protein
LAIFALVPAIPLPFLNALVVFIRGSYNIVTGKQNKMANRS